MKPNDKEGVYQMDSILVLNVSNTDVKAITFGQQTNQTLIHTKEEKKGMKSEMSVKEGKLVLIK